MKRIFLFLLFFGMQAVAQTPLLENITVEPKPNLTYKIGGLGVGVATMRDALLSPVLYKGIVFGAPTTRWQFRQSGWLRINSFQNSVGIDTSTTKSGKTITTLNFAFRQTYLKPLRPENNKWMIYAGPFWEGLGNLRTSLGNVNNVLSYDVGVGIGGSVLLRNNFSIGDTQFQIYNQISTVLLGAYIRPQFSWSLPVVNEEEDKLLVNAIIGSWNINRNWDYRLSVDYHSARYKNRFSRKKRKLTELLAYRASLIWQYQAFTTPSRFQRGQTLIQFGPIVRL